MRPNRVAILRDAALRAAPQDEVLERHASSPVFFAAPGTPASLFPFPRKGNGAPGGARGLAKAPLAGWWTRRAPTAEPGYPGQPLRGRAPPLTEGAAPPGAPLVKLARSLRKLDCDAHCRRTAPPMPGLPGIGPQGCPPSNVTRDDALCEQGGLNIRAVWRAGISFFGRPPAASQIGGYSTLKTEPWRRKCSQQPQQLTSKLANEARTKVSSNQRILSQLLGARLQHIPQVSYQTFYTIVLVLE